jgi:outer membrane protein
LKRDWSGKLKITTALLTACLLSAALTQSATAEDYKIGAVNSVRLWDQAPQSENMRAQLEKEFAPRDRELVNAQKKLKEKEDRLAKDAAIMSENERRNLEREIIESRRDLKRAQDEFREDLTFRRNEEMAKIQKEVVEAIQIVAKQNNFDVVLFEGVMYASAKVDMTQLVIDYLKKQPGGGAAAAPAAAAPAPAPAAQKAGQ